MVLWVAGWNSETFLHEQSCRDSGNWGPPGWKSRIKMSLYCKTLGWKNFVFFVGHFKIEILFGRSHRNLFRASQIALWISRGRWEVQNWSKNLIQNFFILVLYLLKASVTFIVSVMDRKYTLSLHICSQAILKIWTISQHKNHWFPSLEWDVDSFVGLQTIPLLA